MLANLQENRAAAVDLQCAAQPELSRRLGRWERLARIWRNVATRRLAGMWRSVVTRPRRPRRIWPTASLSCLSPSMQEWCLQMSEPLDFRERSLRPWQITQSKKTGWPSLSSRVEARDSSALGA